MDRAVSMFKTLKSDTSSSSLIGASNLLFFVNGRRETIPSSSVDTRMTLLQYLRQSGERCTKLGCGGRMWSLYGGGRKVRRNKPSRSTLL